MDPNGQPIPNNPNGNGIALPLVTNNGPDTGWMLPDGRASCQWPQAQQPGFPAVGHSTARHSTQPGFQQPGIFSNQGLNNRGFNNRGFNIPGFPVPFQVQPGQQQPFPTGIQEPDAAEPGGGAFPGQQTTTTFGQQPTQQPGPPMTGVNPRTSLINQILTTPRPGGFNGLARSTAAYGGSKMGIRCQTQMQVPLGTNVRAQATSMHRQSVLTPLRLPRWAARRSAAASPESPANSSRTASSFTKREPLITSGNSFTTSPKTRPAPALLRFRRYRRAGERHDAEGTSPLPNSFAPSTASSTGTTPSPHRLRQPPLPPRPPRYLRGLLPHSRKEAQRVVAIPDHAGSA